MGFKDAALTVVYGDSHFWRAEAVRIALSIGGKSFEDKRLPRDEFKKLQESKDPMLPFGQIPVLLVDGKPLAQTGAICSYVGRNTGLYPLGDDFACAKVDELIAFATDITGLFGPSMRETDETKKMEMRKELEEVKLPKAMAQLERVIKANSAAGTYFSGEKLTIADLCLWRMFGWITAGVLDGIPTTVLDAFPGVTTCVKNVDAVPEVQAWKAKWPKFYNK